MFHRFHQSGTRARGQGSLTELELEHMLRETGLEHILPAAEWLERTRTGSLREGDVCLTFDDGLRSQLAVALPVLERLGLTAFWFVFSSVFEGGIDRNEVYGCFAASHFDRFDDFVDAFIAHYPAPEDVFAGSAFQAYAATVGAACPFYTRKDLQFRFIRNNLERNEYEQVMDAMIERSGTRIADIASDLWLENDHLVDLAARGHVVGLHSYDHPFELARLTAGQQQEQYRRNYEHIRRVTGRRPSSMSHPLNSYSPATLAILTDMGIVCGFRSVMNPPSAAAPTTSALELGRLDSAELLRQIVAS